MKHKPFTRFLSLLLVVATLAGLFTLPASAASLNGSGTVNIQYLGRHEYLSKSTGGSLSGSSWSYTSNDGLTGTAYCVNWGLSAVSPNKALTLQEYNRNPQTMGVFANGYPMRTLEQFKELHPDDVRGIASLTEDEYKYATQVAVWASCGQLSVPGTSFTAGRAALVEPTSDAQKIRVYDSVKAMLKYSAHWTKNLYTGLSIRAEEDKDVRGVEVLNEYGLEGAAADNEDGIKKETINGKEYYTRLMYLASATSTWIDGRKTKVYSTDAPPGDHLRGGEQLPPGDGAGERGHLLQGGHQPVPHHQPQLQRRGILRDIQGLYPRGQCRRRGQLYHQGHGRCGAVQPVPGL